MKSEVVTRVRNLVSCFSATRADSSQSNQEVEIAHSGHWQHSVDRTDGSRQNGDCRRRRARCSAEIDEARKLDGCQQEVATLRVKLADVTTDVNLDIIGWLTLCALEKLEVRP